jgi:DNA-binding LytR/AlgR family response regulator
MKVLIVEDESQSAKRLQDLLIRYDNGIQVLGSIPSVSKTLAYFGEENAVIPDLIFLDIHLEDDLGFRILDDLPITIPVIFTTAYSDYMLQAFRSFSIDYLLKPVNFKELSSAIDKFKDILSLNLTAETGIRQLLDSLPKPEYKDRFMISVGSRIQSIPVSQVAYFSYQEKSAFITTTEGRLYAIDYSLDKLVQLVDSKNFFRVNRSFIVSFNSIVAVHAYSQGKLKVDLLPKSQLEVFVSTEKITAFKEWLGK